MANGTDVHRCMADTASSVELLRAEDPHKSLLLSVFQPHSIYFETKAKARSLLNPDVVIYGVF